MGHPRLHEGEAADEDGLGAARCQGRYGAGRWLEGGDNAPRAERNILDHGREAGSRHENSHAQRRPMDRMVCDCIRAPLRLGNGAGELVREHAGAPLLDSDRALLSSGRRRPRPHRGRLCHSWPGREERLVAPAGARRTCWRSIPACRSRDHDRLRNVRVGDRAMEIRRAHADHTRHRTHATPAMDHPSAPRNRSVSDDLAPRIARQPDNRADGVGARAPHRAAAPTSRLAIDAIAARIPRLEAPH